MMSDAPAQQTGNPEQDNPTTTPTTVDTVVTQQVRHVPVEDVVPHPDNVRSAVGDVSELAASIAEQGVLQPLTVATMDVFLTHNPDMVNRGLTIGDWVVIAGHRRLAAATQAQVATVPVIVRDDLAAADTATTSMIIENVHREGLSPLEEARAFARLRDMGWSQRKIAEATGVSHGQVAKRLSLLRLPRHLQDRLETGKLTVADALKLLELPDEEIAEAWKTAQKETWRTLAEVVTRFKQARRAKEKETEVLKELAERGIEVIDDPHDRFGRAEWNHRHPASTTLEQIANPGDTIAAVYRGLDDVQVRFYSRTIPLDEQDDDAPGGGASGGSTTAAERAERQQRDAQIETDNAAGATAAADRAEACAWLVTSDPLPVDLAAEILADFVLVNTALDEYGPATTAAGWLGTPLNPDNDTADAATDGNYAGVPDSDAEELWVDAQGDAGGLTALRAAVGTALADLEKSLPAPRNWRGELAVWSTRQIRHVRRLVEHAGHELHPIEQAVIDHSEAARAAVTVDQDDADQHDTDDIDAEQDVDVSVDVNADGDVDVDGVAVNHAQVLTDALGAVSPRIVREGRHV